MTKAKKNIGCASNFLLIILLSTKMHGFAWPRKAANLNNDDPGLTDLYIYIYI